MNRLVLVAYASKHGSTEEIALEIAGRLSAHGIVADVRATRDVSGLDGYDAVVLHADAGEFLRRHRDGLAERPLAIFDARDRDGIRVWADAVAVRFAAQEAVAA